MSGTVHGNDFTFLGFDEELDELKEVLKSYFDLKVYGRFVSDAKDDEEIALLGRTSTSCSGGTKIKANAKHREASTKYCGLDSTSKLGKKDEAADMFSEGIGKG